MGARGFLRAHLELADSATADDAPDARVTTSEAGRQLEALCGRRAAWSDPRNSLFPPASCVGVRTAARPAARVSPRAEAAASPLCAESVNAILKGELALESLQTRQLCAESKASLCGSCGDKGFPRGAAHLKIRNPKFTKIPLLSSIYCARRGGRPPARRR